ncbi:hypothetical protein [Candidatus Raskinella chloraquaticus]
MRELRATRDLVPGTFDAARRCCWKGRQFLYFSDSAPFVTQMGDMSMNGISAVSEDMLNAVSSASKSVKDAASSAAKAVSKDASCLSDTVGREASEVADKVSAHLKDIGVDTGVMANAAKEQVSELQRLIGEELRARPLRALGIAAVLGVFVGLISAR